MRARVSLSLMGVSGVDRRQRLLDLVGTVLDLADADRPVRCSELGAVAMRTWALTRRSSQDYVDDLIAMGWLVLRPGGTVAVTRAGERAVLDLPARAKAPPVAPSEAPLPPQREPIPPATPPINPN